MNGDSTTESIVGASSVNCLRPDMMLGVEPQAGSQKMRGGIVLLRSAGRGAACTTSVNTMDAVIHLLPENLGAAWNEKAKQYASGGQPRFGQRRPADCDRARAA